MRRRFVGVLACAVVLSLAFTAFAGAAAPSPDVIPVPGQPLMHGHANYDMADVGYQQSEVFIEGTANAYGSDEPLTTDGQWTLEPSHQADFKTRIVVNRPIDPKDFNGTVVVEWFNVSGGGDGSPFWMQMHVELIRRGYAYAAVSAQAVGVNQLQCPSTPPLPTGCPATGDAERYGSLVHPGDSFSYDMFSQAGQAILDNPEVVLGGLEAERLVGAGESQSAGRLVTYINGFHPLHDVYDSFFVYSRGAAGAALRQAPQTPAVAVPSGTIIREDLNVPTIVFQAENDTGGLAARQDDTSIFRLWEVAGTAHFDHYGLNLSANDVGQHESYVDWFRAQRFPTRQASSFVCNNPINNGAATYVLRAGISHLNRWMIDGTEPPSAPRLQRTGNTGAPWFEVDAHGISLGGIRTPAVDAPVARLSGFGQTGGTALFCNSFGTTTPFTQDNLRDLYGDQVGFSDAWTEATLAAHQAGFLLAEDALHLVAAGVQSDVLREVTYTANFTDAECTALSSIATALDLESAADVVKLGVDGFRGIAEAGNAHVVDDPAPNEGPCQVDVTWPAEQSAAISAAAAAWGVDEGQLHQAGGIVVIQLIVASILQNQ